MRINNFINQGFQFIQQSERRGTILTTIAVIAYVAAVIFFCFVGALGIKNPVYRPKSYTITHLNKLSFDPQNKQERRDIEFLKKHQKQNFFLPDGMSLEFDTRIRSQLNLTRQEWDKRGEVIRNLMKIEDFEKLPILKIHKKLELSDLDPQDLSSPLMKGLKKDSSLYYPFLAFRLKDNQNSQVFVYTLFFDGLSRDQWHVTSNYKDATDILSGIVSPPNPTGIPHLTDPSVEELAVLSQIIQNKHNRFTLV